MEQYISKAAVVAEIERLLILAEEDSLDGVLKYYRGRISALKAILSFLDTLEVKGVNLDKEIKKYSMELAMKENNGDWLKDITATAKHFYELGLQAQK